MMKLATNFKIDSAKAKMLFDKFTRRALADFGIRSVVSTEDSDLDRDCGIDAVAMKGDNTIFLASRIIEVKPNCGDYDCFSLRNKRLSGTRTEIEKLEHNIKNNLPRPHFHVQTFVDDGLANVGIVRTRDLVNYVATHETKIKTTRNGTEFKLAPWNDLIRAGVSVRTIQIDAKK